MIKKQLNFNDENISFDADGGVTVRIVGDDDKLPSLADSLSRQTTDQLPHQFKFALLGDNLILQGELISEFGQLNVHESKQRLHEISSGQPSTVGDLLDDDEVAVVLAQTGPDWQREDEGWRTTISLPGGFHCEISAAADQYGVCVSTELAKWDGELDSTCQMALCHFLGKSNAQIRYARLVLDEQRVIAESITTADRLDSEFCNSVWAVAATFRAISRETNALLSPELARQYLEAQQTET